MTLYPSSLLSISDAICYTTQVSVLKHLQMFDQLGLN